MLIAVSRLDDVGLWLRTSALEIVLLVVGAVLLTRLVSWVGARITRRIDAEVAETDALVASEATKHRHAVAQVLTWVAVVLVYAVTAVLVVQRLGIPITGLVAPATVVGVALGFGAQRVVQDVLAGFFIIAERQYGFGDVIRITALGAPVVVSGTVEDVNLRTTRLRSLDGEVITTPNGQIIQVTNLSRDWARAVVDVPVPASVEVNRISELLRNAITAAYADPDLHPLLLDPPTVMGVESLEMSELHVRVVARTLPGKQFDVGRILRARIAMTLQAEGVILPAQPELTGTSGAP